MDFEEIIYKRRTIRRFKQDIIPDEILNKIIDFARVAPAASNIQGLEYIIVHTSRFAIDVQRKCYRGKSPYHPC